MDRVSCHFYYRRTRGARSLTAITWLIKGIRAPLTPVANGPSLFANEKVPGRFRVAIGRVSGKSGVEIHSGMDVLIGPRYQKGVVVVCGKTRAGKHVFEVFHVFDIPGG